MPRRSAAVAATIAAGQREAGDEPLHVPLPRPRQGLVEVVEVEDEPPLRRGEGAEVGEVGVAAELRLEARARGRGEIGRHHRRGAAVEGEGRGQHAAVAQRHQLPDPRAGLVLEQLDRVRAIDRRRSTRRGWSAARPCERPCRRRRARRAIRGDSGSSRIIDSGYGRLGERWIGARLQLVEALRRQAPSRPERGEDEEGGEEEGRLQRLQLGVFVVLDQRVDRRRVDARRLGPRPAPLRRRRSCHRR